MDQLVRASEAQLPGVLRDFSSLARTTACGLQCITLMRPGQMSYAHPSMHFIVTEEDAMECPNSPI
eukprot:16401-Eustigmatos_ZCMA.PRE.1